jgi:hypothetical protein
VNTSRTLRGNAFRSAHPARSHSTKAIQITQQQQGTEPRTPRIPLEGPCMNNRWDQNVESLQNVCCVVYRARGLTLITGRRRRRRRNHRDVVYAVDASEGQGV